MKSHVLHQKQVRIQHSLIGYPPYRPEARETIPRGAEITITNYDHNETDSLVESGGRTLIVNKDCLISFEDPLSL
jgi:hypothetical protein